MYDLVAIFGPPCFIVFINNDHLRLFTVSKLFLFFTWCILFLTVIVRFGVDLEMAVVASLVGGLQAKVVVKV